MGWGVRGRELSLLLLEGPYCGPLKCSAGFSWGTHWVLLGVQTALLESNKRMCKAALPFEANLKPAS